MPTVASQMVFLHPLSRITLRAFRAQSAIKVSGAVLFAQGKSLVRPLLSVLMTTRTGSEAGALSKAATMSALFSGVPVTMVRLACALMDSGRRTSAVTV